MLPPQMTSIRQLSLEEGISEATLHIWRREARNKGQLLPDADTDPEGWSSRDKFAAVLEVAALNEADLAAYCRERGLYPEQIKAWRQACEATNDWAQASTAYPFSEALFRTVCVRRLARSFRLRALNPTAKAREFCSVGVPRRSRSG